MFLSSNNSWRTSLTSGASRLLAKEQCKNLSKWRTVEKGTMTQGCLSSWRKRLSMCVIMIACRSDHWGWGGGSKIKCNHIHSDKGSVSHMGCSARPPDAAKNRLGCVCPANVKQTLHEFNSKFSKVTIETEHCRSSLELQFSFLCLSQMWANVDLNLYVQHRIQIFSTKGKNCTDNWWTVNVQRFKATF